MLAGKLVQCAVGFKCQLGQHAFQEGFEGVRMLADEACGACSSWASTACFKARIKACSVIANLLLLAAHILETIVIHEHEHISVLHNLHDLPFRFFGLYHFRRAGVSLRLYVHLRRRRASASSLSGFMAPCRSTACIAPVPSWRDTR